MGSLRPKHLIIKLLGWYEVSIFKIQCWLHNVNCEMKVRIGNKWLLWCGTSLFPLYIYQRLPMNAIRGWVGDSWVSINPNLYIGICFFLTVIIALLYNKYLRIKLK